MLAKVLEKSVFLQSFDGEEVGLINYADRAVLLGYHLTSNIKLKILLTAAKCLAPSRVDRSATT